MNLTKVPIHFIGIGGAGMSGIAKILLQLGAKISGSDLKESETIIHLREMGAKINIGHDPDNIGADVRTVVYSSAIPQDNPEMQEAKKRGIEILARAEMLARLMARQESIAVAGAHGKTTTTAMISLMLELNDMDPTIIIGGDLRQIGSNAKLGRGKYLVAEADESDGSFLKLFPKIAVITNIENDHLDYYRTVKNIVNAFVRFLEQIPADGFAVICLDNEELVKIKNTVPANYVTYAITRKGRIIRPEPFFHGTKSKRFITIRKNRYFGTNVPVSIIYQCTGGCRYRNGIGTILSQVAAGLKHLPGPKDALNSLIR